jgi:AmmeMemoRadiSam system protein A
MWHVEGAVDAELVAAARVPLSAEAKRFLLRLSRQTLTSYLDDGSLPPHEATAVALREPRATFVTLRRRADGELRGCRGQRVATHPLVTSVVQMTVASAVDDPRFEPVRLAEVPGLHIEISALTPPEPIRPEQVVVGRHGLIVSAGRVAGLLLPQVPLEYGWDREQFLRAVCEKAGLPGHAWRVAGVRLEAFEAEVWQEEK